MSGRPPVCDAGVQLLLRRGPQERDRLCFAPTKSIFYRQSRRYAQLFGGYIRHNPRAISPATGHDLPRQRPINKPTVFLPGAGNLFDANGNLTDGATAERLTELLTALPAWSKQLA